MIRTIELTWTLLAKSPALSIRQPWAELILRGRKTIELRRWETSYRGTVWIHAGREADRGAADYFGIADAFHGGFVGAVMLRDCVLLTPHSWALWSDRHLGGRIFQPNHWAWLLEDMIRFKRPIPAIGRLKLFLPAPDTAALLWEALVDARNRHVGP